MYINIENSVKQCEVTWHVNKAEHNNNNTRKLFDNNKIFFFNRHNNNFTNFF